MPDLSPERDKLISSVLRGLYYEVTEQAVYRWWEPGTTMERPDPEAWAREELDGFTEIPLSDVILLADSIWPHWRGFTRGNPIATAATEQALSDRLAQPEAERYHELLYAVQTKHPGETRHETALRYIREAEERHWSGQAAFCIDPTPAPPGPTTEEE